MLHVACAADVNYLPHCVRLPDQRRVRTLPREIGGVRGHRDVRNALRHRALLLAPGNRE
jgi:hypothetical protein